MRAFSPNIGKQYAVFLQKNTAFHFATCAHAAPHAAAQACHAWGRLAVKSLTELSPQEFADNFLYLPHIFNALAARLHETDWLLWQKRRVTRQKSVGHTIGVLRLRGR